MYWNKIKCDGIKRTGEFSFGFQDELKRKRVVIKFLDIEALSLNDRKHSLLVIPNCIKLPSDKHLNSILQEKLDHSFWALGAVATLD